jgi:hypothetical protein
MSRSGLGAGGGVRFILFRFACWALLWLFLWALRSVQLLQKLSILTIIRISNFQYASQSWSRCNSSERFEEHSKLSPTLLSRISRLDDCARTHYRRGESVVVGKPWKLPNNASQSVLEGTAGTLRWFRTSFMSVCISSRWDAVGLTWNVYPTSKMEFRECMGPIQRWKPSERVFSSINPGKLAIQWIEFIRCIVLPTC